MQDIRRSSFGAHPSGGCAATPASIVHVPQSASLPRPARCSQEEARRRDYTVIVPEQCVWSLEEDTGADGERCKLLVATMARPAPTEEEVTYKKGGRGAPQGAGSSSRLPAPGAMLLDATCSCCAPLAVLPSSSAIAGVKRHLRSWALSPGLEAVLLNCHSRRSLPPPSQASGRTTALPAALDRCTTRAGASLLTTRMCTDWRTRCRWGLLLLLPRNCYCWSQLPLLFCACQRRMWGAFGTAKPYRTAWLLLLPVYSATVSNPDLPVGVCPGLRWCTRVGTLKRARS